MTPNRMQVAWEKYIKMIPIEHHDDLYHALEEADDRCLDALMLLPTKSVTTTLLFSIFLGGIGVDRFYIGSVGLGVGKLALRLSAAILPTLLQFPELGLILGLASLIWQIIDIFQVRNAVKRYNFEMLWMFLRKNRKTVPINELFEDVR